MKNIRTLIICLLIFSLYFFDSGGSYLLISYILGLILFLITLFDIRKGQELVLDKTLYFFLAFVVICLSGVFFASSPERVLNRVILISFNIMLFFTVLNYLSSFERIKILLNAFIYSGTALSVYLLLNSNLGSRIGWIVGNVNRIGNLLSFALIFAGYYLFVEKKFIYIPHFIIIGISVLLSGARQSLLFCASTFFILLILRYRRGLKNKLKLIVILIVVAALGYFLLFQVPIVYKVLGSRIEILNNFIVDRKAGGSSINTRMRMIRFGLKAFKKRPLMGFGIDHYKFLYGRFFRTVYAHNNYIELLVDTGIIGFVLFYGAFVNVLRLSIQGIKSNHRFSELGLAFVIGLLVLGNFSVYYAYKTIFVIFALFIAHHRLSVKEDTSKQVETLLENESL